MNQEVVKGKNPLGYKPIGELLGRFALPAVISMLVNAVYNIVDQIFIGRGVGYLGNAATTIAFPVVTIILSVATLLGAGGSAFAAIKLGEKREDEAEKTLGNMFILLLGLGVLVAVLGLIFLEPMLTLFGASDNTMLYAKQYTSILLIGSPFNMLGVGLSNMARTDGSPAVSMISILAGAILNTILDPIYIFVFKWGVTGAAIATVTSQIITAVVLFFYFRYKGKSMHLKKSCIKLDGAICKGAITLGISSGITQIAATILQIILNNSLNFYGGKTSVGGDAALSAMGIVSKISMILLAVCIGIGIGSQPILGFNRGANNIKRVRSTYLYAISAATIISILGWGVCELFPRQILTLFGSADPNFTGFAVKCMRIYLLGIFTAGFQVVSTSYFQSTGQPMKASVLSMLRQLILLIPAILILPLFMGLDGILAAGPFADLSSFVIVLIFAGHEWKKLTRMIKLEGQKLPA